MDKASVSKIWLKTSRIILQVLTFGIAAFLLLSGGAKLLGVDEMVDLYQSIGLGQWFRYFSGFVEVAAAVLLVVPSMRLAGILLAGAIMVAGFLEHIFALGRIPGAPAVLFATVLIILYIKRPRSKTSEQPG